MSDSDVLASVESLEDLLTMDPESLTPEEIELWHLGFLEAVASAERGPEWPGIVARAHATSARLESFLAILCTQRDEIRHQMGLQSQGERALKAYQPR